MTFDQKQRLLAALKLLEGFDPNGHSCTCSGCENGVIDYQVALDIIRHLSEEPCQYSFY